MGKSRLVVPLICIIISVAYFVASINLPRAKLGDPYSPLYFPIMISIFLFIVSIIYLIKELKSHYHRNDEIELLFKGRVLFLIISTIIISLIYTFIFEVLGYLISTIFLLMSILFILNGRKRWLLNITVSTLFSLGSWYVFTKLLEVSLP